MSAKTIKIPETLFRFVDLDRASVDAEKRTVSLSFSSESPVRRWFGYELLDHGAKSVRLDRLKRGGPLLLDHNTRDQIGVVESASIEKGRGVAVVRFSKSARGQEIFQDVQDGIRSNVSVGYRVHKMKLDGKEGDVETYRATDWEPMEISIVSVPADTTVGVGRSEERSVEITLDEDPAEPQEPMKRNILLDQTPAEGGGGAAASAPQNDPRPERKRIASITALANQHNFTGDLARWIEEGTSLEDVRAHILEKRYGAKPVAAPQLDPMIGMSRKEIGRYSLVRAIHTLASGKPLEGLEREASEAVQKRIGKDPTGFFVPADVSMRSLGESYGVGVEGRALNASTLTAGGAVVGTDVLGSSMIELLRNKMKVVSLGARVLSGLVGNVAIPRHTGGATAYWLSETETITDSQQTFGQLALTPHRLGASTPYSKQLLAQASLDVEGLVREDLMAVLAIAKDLAAISGNGADGAPRGIQNTTNVNSVTFGAAPTWAKVVQFETEISSDNADVANMGWLIPASVRGKWKTVEVASSTGVFLIPVNSTTCNGYRYEVSNQLSGGKIIFGNWADLIIADWDGMDVVVDPYTLAKSNQVQVTVNLMTDLGVRHPESFCVSSDSAAQ